MYVLQIYYLNSVFARGIEDGGIEMFVVVCMLHQL